MNNFCVLPFNSISIAPTGELRPCCNTDGYKYSLNVKDADIISFINHRDAVKLRDSFIENKQDPACDRCWKIESIGNKSFRHTSNEDSDKGIHTIDFTAVKNNIDYDDIKYIDITLGNKCNLACRMCNSSSSSLYARQMVMLNQHLGPVDTDFDRATRNKILEAIDKSKNISVIYLLGGEPLVNDFHDEIVDLLIQTKRSKNIRLHYSTNLQIDVEKYLQLWENFRFIDLGVSVDGTHEVYEYIRWPGTWNKLLKNLQKVIEYKRNGRWNLLHPSIATTVQNLNAENLPNLITAITELDSVMGFYFIPVTGCNFLHLCPKDVLHDAVKKLSVLNDPYGRIAELINFYNTAIEKEDNQKDIKKFFDSQKKFDGLRDQNLFKSIPYFRNYALQNQIPIW